MFCFNEFFNGMYEFAIIFFFKDTATTEIYTLSLHDALPICSCCSVGKTSSNRSSVREALLVCSVDRKSTRLNSSHVRISYAVFCLKKKNLENYISNTLLKEMI